MTHPCPRCGVTLDEYSLDGLCVRCLAAVNFATETLVPDDSTDAFIAAPAIEAIAAHFPQLELLGMLGRGGMGVVYKARQKTLGRLVALKLLAPERIGDPRLAQRFIQEAQALAALNHPNIVTIHDFGQAGEFYYLLMEFVDGVNLRQAMAAGRFAPEQALMVVPPICEALQYAHDHGVVHRDIKPENLLLDKEGRVKIADFGIAKMLGRPSQDSSGAESQPAGTPQYMAPEQLLQRSSDHRADIYSLGVVLYEMLTGELPGPKLQPPSQRVQVDVGIDAIVLRALEKSPELRFNTATEFRTQIERLIQLAKQPSSRSSVSDVVVESRGIATDPGKRLFGKPAFVGAAMAGLVIVSMFIFAGLNRENYKAAGDQAAIEVGRQATSTSEKGVENTRALSDSTARNSFFVVRSGKVLTEVENAHSTSKQVPFSRKLRIRVPAANHDLNPFRGLTAPRLLTKVSGDFELRAKVTGDFKPGSKTMGKGNPFNGAGILIWQDNDNYLRIERNAWREDDSFWCYPPLIEYWRDHEYAGMNVPSVPAQFFPGESTWLKAVRRSNQITVSLSHDGTNWQEVRSFAVELAAEVQVGIAALNTSDEPFVVDFENLNITSNGIASTVLFKNDRDNDRVEVVGVERGEDRIDVQFELSSNVGPEPRANTEASKGSD